MRVGRSGRALHNESCRGWSDFVMSSPRLTGKTLATHLIGRGAVYLIGPKPGRPIKLGMTGDPGDRLCGLQTSNFEELRLHLVCWVADRNVAGVLEGRCHEILKKEGRHIRGEWFDAEPIFAAKVIDRASIDVGCRLVPHKDLIKKFGLSQDPLQGAFWE